MDQTISNLFTTRRAIQGSFSLYYPPQVGIGEMGQLLNEALSPYYQPAIAVNAPNDAGPEFPRWLLTSQHGFSQILVSQTNMAMTAQYSPRWQQDVRLGLDYFRERVPLLSKAVAALSTQLLFVGFGSVAQFSTQDEDKLLRELAKLHGGGFAMSNPHEVQLRLSNVIDSRFFLNLTARSYRSWSIAPVSIGTVRFASGNQTDQGLELTVDFNDRYSYNETRDYVSSPEVALGVLERGYAEFLQIVDDVEAGKWL